MRINLSPEWSEETLGSIVSFKTGKLDSNAAKPDGDYPFFTCSQETFRTDTFSFDTECILLGGNNANGIYPLKYYSGKFDAYQRTYVIRSLDKNRLINRFLYYALRPKLELLKNFSTGVSTKFLTLSILKGIDIELPPLPTQQKIASILSAYDDLIENNTRRIKILEEMAQTIYTEWFVKFRFPGHEKVKMVDSELGMVPEGWEVCCLGEVLHFFNGKSIKAEEFGLYKVYGSNGTIGRNNKFNYDNAIIIGRVGAYCGSINYENGKLWATDNTIVAKPNSSNNELLYFHLLKNLSLNSYSGGSAQPLLTQITIKQIRIVIANDSLCLLFFKIAQPIFKMLNKLRLQIDTAQTTRDSLLPKLISGEIDVEDLDINTGVFEQ